MIFQNFLIETYFNYYNKFLFKKMLIKKNLLVKIKTKCMNKKIRFLIKNTYIIFSSNYYSFCIYLIFNCYYFYLMNDHSQYQQICHGKSASTRVVFSSNNIIKIRSRSVKLFFLLILNENKIFLYCKYFYIIF